MNGAAYATARTVSVEEFIRKGAAFGIRKSVLKPGARTSDKCPAVDWKSDVAVALDSVRTLLFPPKNIGLLTLLAITSDLRSLTGHGARVVPG